MNKLILIIPVIALICGVIIISMAYAPVPTEPIHGEKVISQAEREALIEKVNELGNKAYAEKERLQQFIHDREVHQYEPIHIKYWSYSSKYWVHHTIDGNGDLSEIIILQNEKTIKQNDIIIGLLEEIAEK